MQRQLRIKYKQVKQIKIGLILIVLLTNVSVIWSQNNFVLQHSENSINIYSKAKQNRSLIEYKGELTLKHQNIESVLAILKDYKNYQSWIYNCKRAKFIKEANNNIYLYQISKASWPFKDRDYVLCLKPESSNKNTITIPFYAVSNIVSSKREYTRIDEFNGKWIIEKIDKKIKVSMYGSFNPKMKLPKYLKQKYEKKIPLNTLNKLKTLLLASK